MRLQVKDNFITILHLAEMYQRQYKESELCLSPEQNEASFKDFVQQYHAALYWGETPSPVIRPDVPLF